ncbi:GGDEF domain-containing protein [Lachnospiraceae bacterium MD1]|uniref:GGDEF domain-containing protein n=1 Tax=Variimorphobacter saccharofermentans TaxID=2755051 RepID=A0A839K0T4_9FIRM|nr:GGDEF domain-containing protein [Variimorphobacter saccharofermentans]MBB2183260.1 GGDEF domain-containing protein [Variimorphobacter saccharofermentans]
MNVNKLEEFTLEDISELFIEKVDTILIVNAEIDSYRCISKKGIFIDIIEDSGNYHDLIEKLWFHLSNSKKITSDYQVFVPSFGKFHGKYSKRLKLVYNNIPHIIQMTIYPINDKNIYMLILDELDNSEYIQEYLTNEKINNIQNTYLFSMYVDLIRDTTNSISITEISEEPMNATELKYSNWRMMIVNMIWYEDQPLFLEHTDPDYLKKKLAPGRTTSFDCQMQNLDGKYIWVKLIFSRAETNNNDDFRFVFLVQDIHENSLEILSTLKKNEELASKDSLTGVYNHGRIETELYNAIENSKEIERPLSIMMMDIDYFKTINDIYGHSIGDITLKHFAVIACDFLKSYNIKIGRWGGDEFVAVCYNIDAAELTAIAENMRMRISEESFDTAGNITCSIGITGINKNDKVKGAFDRVDKALYLAKSSGRNCVKVER